MIYEAYMFYLIHVKEAAQNYDLNYDCIIWATAFSLVILLLKPAFARSEGRTVREALFDPAGGNLIAIAMLFTLVADYYLVASSAEKPLHGVSFFLGTQLFIFLHIMANDKDRRCRRTNILTRLVLTAVLLIAIYAILGSDVDTLSIISAIYYANLCANAIFAHRSGRGGIMLTIGLILFALCDINVAFSALDSLYVGGLPEGTLLYELVYSEIDIIWVFYIPSQTLIPLTMVVCEE